MEYEFSNRLKNLSGNAIREIFKVLQDPEMISFAGGLPASNCLPCDLVAKYTEEIMKSPKAIGVLQYGGTEGLPYFRETVSSYVSRVGIQANVDQTLIISGGQQGIDLTLKAFTNPGDNVLVQGPTYLAFLHIAKTYEVNAYSIESGDDGVDLADLEEKIKKYNPKVVYLVPTFHNPTGLTIKLEKRQAIAELTARYGVMLIEDDPYRELRYYGEHLPSIKSFDEAGNVIYLTSFSKVVSPGLRCGAAIAAEPVIRKLTIAKQATDVHTSSLSQAIINEFILNGDLERGIAASIPIYRDKLTKMIDCLEKEMPASFSFTRPEGGLFIWGTFTEESGISCAERFSAALAKKVAYVTGVDFFCDGRGKNNVRLNFSNATNEQIEIGVKRLAEVFGE